MQPANGPSSLAREISIESPQDQCNRSEQSPSNEPISVSAKTLRRHRVGYFISSIGLGPAIAGVGTYVSLRIQDIAFAVGHTPGAAYNTGCPPSASSCLIKFGSGEVNLTSYLLYLGALGSGISGAVTLILSGIGDRMHFQREQYIFLLIAYGIFCAPLAALRSLSQKTLETNAAIYVVCGVLSTLTTAWSNIFVPFGMQQANDISTLEASLHECAEVGTDSAPTQIYQMRPPARNETQGLSMSVSGFNGLCAGQALLYLIAIGLTYVNSAYAGLWTTTGAGAMCAILALAAWQLLPQPLRMADERSITKLEMLGLPFLAARTFFRGLHSHPDAFKFLIAYTVYGDAVAAFDGICAQLFNLSLRPTLREYTAYILAGSVVSILSATLVLVAFAPLRRRFGVEMRHWILASFFVVTFCMIWSCIGISPKAKIGLKHRWEFYFIHLLLLAANSVVQVIFRVSFAYMIPRGSEIKYFGIQLAISLATAWIPGLISAPIVNATNDLRLPSVVYTACVLVAAGLVLWTDEGRGRDRLRLNGEAPAAASS